MRQIPLSAALLTYLDDLEYTEAALAADPDAADLASAFEDEIGGWEKVFKKERAGRREVTRAEAVVAVRNAQLDSLTLRFAANVRANDGNGSLLARFFSTAPSRFVRKGLRDQCDKTMHVMVAEIGKLEAKHPLHAFAKPLTSTAKAALESLDGRNQAKGARQSASNDVDEWKEGVNQLRLTTYAELLKIAAAKGYPKSWADTFFVSSSASAAVDEPGDAPGDEGKKPAPTP
jgi:hypothetical protein